MNKVVGPEHVAKALGLGTLAHKQRVLSMYKKILTLQIKALPKSDRDLVRQGTKMVRDNFRKNASLKDPNEIVSCLEHGDIYISRLKAQTLGEESEVKYNSKDFWEAYYNQEDTRGIMDEWYCEYQDLKEYLPPIGKDSSVLVLGSGISALGANIAVE